MESFQTSDTDAEIWGDGHQDSLLLHRRRRRIQRPPASPQDHRDWLARQEECQGTTNNSDTLSIVPDTDPHETGGTPDSPPETDADRGAIARGYVYPGQHLASPDFRGRPAHGGWKWRPAQSLMKCLSWNIRGLRDDRRWGTMERYLREWGAEVICPQETMLA